MRRPRNTPNERITNNATTTLAGSMLFSPRYINHSLYLKVLPNQHRRRPEIPLMRPLECVHCGHTIFKKTTTVSCSAVPPFFKCAKCGKYQPGKINFALSPITGWSIRTKDDLFVRHLRCRVCEKEVFEFDPDVLPEGWKINIEETIDPLGNPMWRHYSYCGKHQPPKIDWI